MESSIENDLILEVVSEAKEKFEKLKKDGDNPYFKSKYADLNECLDSVVEILAELGVEVFQPTVILIEGYNIVNTVETELVHIDSGQWIKANLMLPDFEDMQKIGGAITYARRYTLKALLSLQDDDDDGETAVGRKSFKGKSTPKSSTTSGRGSKKKDEPKEEPKEESKDEPSNDSFQRRGKRGSKKEEPKEESTPEEKPASSGRRGRRSGI